MQKFPTIAETTRLTDDERLVVAAALNDAPGGQRPLADHVTVGGFTAHFAREALTAALTSDRYTDEAHALMRAVLERLGPGSEQTVEEMTSERARELVATYGLDQLATLVRLAEGDEEEDVNGAALAKWAGSARPTPLEACRAAFDLLEELRGSDLLDDETADQVGADVVIEKLRTVLY